MFKVRFITTGFNIRLMDSNGERERERGSKWLSIFLLNSLLTPYIYTSYFKDQKRINVSEYQKKKILVHFVVSRNLKCFRCFDSRFSRPCVLFWR